MHIPHPLLPAPRLNAIAPTVMAGCACGLGLVYRSASLTNLLVWMLGGVFEWRIYCFFSFSFVFKFPCVIWRAALNSQRPESFLEPHFCSLNSIPGWPQALGFIPFNLITRQASLEWAIRKPSEHLLILLTACDFLWFQLSGYSQLQG